MLSLQKIFCPNFLTFFNGPKIGDCRWSNTIEGFIACTFISLYYKAFLYKSRAWAASPYLFKELLSSIYYVGAMLTVNEHVQRLKKLAANDKIPSDLRQAFLKEISDLENVMEKPVIDHPLPQYSKRQPKKRDIMDTYLVGKDKQNVRQQKKAEKLHYKNLKKETVKNDGMDFKLTKDHNLFARYSINFKHFNNTFRYAHNDTMEFIKPKLNTLLETKIEDFKSLKVNVTLTATFYKKSFGEMMVDGVKVELKEDVKVAYLRTKTQVCVNKDDIKYAVDQCISELLEKIDEFTNVGSTEESITDPTEISQRKEVIPRGETRRDDSGCGSGYVISSDKKVTRDTEGDERDRSQVKRELLRFQVKPTAMMIFGPPGRGKSYLLKKMFMNPPTDPNNVDTKTGVEQPAIQMIVIFTPTFKD